MTRRSHRRKAPRDLVDAFRQAVRLGRKGDRAAAEAVQFAQLALDRSGPEAIEPFADVLAVDDQGRVRLRGEHRNWSNGSMELLFLAALVADLDWTGAEFTAHVDDLLRSGVEPCEAVRAIARALRYPGQNVLSPSAVATLLRDRAAQIERESEAAAHE